MSFQNTFLPEARINVVEIDRATRLLSQVGKRVLVDAVPDLLVIRHGESEVGAAVVQVHSPVLHDVFEGHYWVIGAESNLAEGRDVA